MRNIKIYIDADSGFSTHNNGLEKLGPNDEVVFYYNSGNNHYTKEQNRNKVYNSCHGKVEFIQTIAGKNSVDFMIAIDVTEYLQYNKYAVIALISGDNHFNIITDILSRKYPDSVFKCKTSISEAYEMKLLEETDYARFSKIMKKIYGKSNGERILNQIEKMFSEKKAKTEKKRSIFDFFRNR